MSLNNTPARNLQHLPINLNTLLPKYRSRVLRNRLEAIRGECKDCGSGAGEADAQKPWVVRGCDV